MRKALAITAGVLALVLVAYVAAGYWLAPRLIRDTLTGQAARHGVQLRIETVRTNPFALSVAVEGVRAAAEQAQELATARRASADLAWASLWEGRWVLDEIRLEAPWVDVERWPGAGGKAGDGELPAILIRRLTVADGTARLGAYGLTLQGLNANAQNLSTRSKEKGQYALATRVESGGEIASSGSVSLAPVSAQGKIEASAIPTSLIWKPVRGAIHASAEYAYEDGRLVLREAAIDGRDIGYAATRVPRLQVSAASIAVPMEAPFEVTLEASVAPDGNLTAHGKVNVQPLQADLQIEAADLPLTDLRPWLPNHITAKLVSGTLSGNGKLSVRRADSDTDLMVGYEGAASVHDLRIEEGDSGRLLLAWKRAESAALRAGSQPLQLNAAEILAHEAEGRLIIEKNGAVNFVTALAGGEKTASAGPPLQIKVDRARLEQGTLHFADRSLENPFEARIHELSGSITGFSTAQGNPARLQFSGRVQRDGVARVNGTIDLDAPRSLADITARFKNLPLAAFNPYVVKFAGYRIASGRLSAELRYQVRDGRLDGKNQLVFEQIQLGEKIEGGKLDLPLELAVALLADRHGRIDLDIPVSGNLQDPEFNFGAIIAQAIGNTVRSIVTAPFRALSSLLGGGRERTPGEVHFNPGAVTLDPREEEHVARLAQVLQERPQLAVVVRGAYDQKRDIAALRERAVRREIVRRAGTEPGDGGEGLEFANPQVLQAAERMYLDRVGGRLELQRLREEASRYGQALVEKLAQSMETDETEAQSLARARAEVVRAALVTQGVDAARVRVAPPAEHAGKSGGVATTITLTSRRAPAEAPEISH